MKRVPICTRTKHETPAPRVILTALEQLEHHLGLLKLGINNLDDMLASLPEIGGPDVPSIVTTRLELVTDMTQDLLKALRVEVETSVTIVTKARNKENT